MAIKNLTGHVKQPETFEELVCSPTLLGGKHEHLMYFAVVNIFFSITAFLGNTLILVALHKESSLHPPSKLLYRCLASTDLCVGLITEPLQVAFLMCLFYEYWILCRYVFATAFIVGYSLGSVSLLTLTAISVDRLLALLLGLRYRLVVTLKRIYGMVTIFWIVSIVVPVSYLIDHRITFWYGNIFNPVCLAISIASYAKIFCALRHNQVQVQGYVHHHRHQQQQLNETVPLNIARYRKAVFSALWVQLALVVCYLPYGIVTTLFSYTGLSLPYMVAWSATVTLVYLNSSLNPLLYCWKISKVRQAVKETIRQALCCP